MAATVFSASYPCSSFSYLDSSHTRAKNIARRTSFVTPSTSLSNIRRKSMLRLQDKRLRETSHGGLLFVGESDSSIKAARQQKEVVMVDPLEAKRLAAEQMKQLQERAKYKRQCEIEASNGGWAMLGLTIGLVIEGYTGKSILSQVAGYLGLLADFLDQYIPS